MCVDEHSTNVADAVRVIQVTRTSAVFKFKKRGKNSGCPTDNQVAISGCPPKLLIVHDLPQIGTTIFCDQ